MRIEPYNPDHLDAVVRLSLRSWAPVFDSLQQAMDIDVYREFFGDVPPARTTVAVSGLPKGARVEIDLLVALP